MAAASHVDEVLGGVYQPDDGSIIINGQAVSIHSVADALDLGIAFIHQELTSLIIWMSQQISPGTRTPERRIFKPHRSPEDVCRGANSRRPFGLDVSSHTLLSKLSMGHQQMVEIAKALSQQARILIMDEPPPA